VSEQSLSSEEKEILEIFRSTGALLEGHFILRSGLRSGHFFQCAQVCQYLDKVGRLAEILLGKLKDVPFDTVLAPAMGGLVIGQEVARQAGARYLFVEKEEGRLALKRNFRFEPGESVLVVEDVITRGGRAQEALDIVSANGGQAVALAVIVDRSEGKASFSVPCFPAFRMSFPTYSPDALPPELAAIPAIKPGS